MCCISSAGDISAQLQPNGPADSEFFENYLARTVSSGITWCQLVQRVCLELQR